jgi:hypothetical protein
MKYLIILFIITLYSCSDSLFPKYKIEGKAEGFVETGDFFRPRKKVKLIKDAIAYTDTIHGYNEDSIWYYNSNGHKVTILAPYVVYEISKNPGK